MNVTGDSVDEEAVDVLSRATEEDFDVAIWSAMRDENDLAVACIEIVRALRETGAAERAARNAAKEEQNGDDR